jgi:hypothetical protein
MRGGVAPVNMNAQIPSLPEGGTIPGVSHAQNHLKAVDNLNQIRASAAGDSLINAQPKQHGGSSKKKRKTKRRKSNVYLLYKMTNEKNKHESLFEISCLGLQVDASCTSPSNHTGTGSASGAFLINLPLLEWNTKTSTCPSLLGSAFCTKLPL